jgi:hypothetical protein
MMQYVIDLLNNLCLKRGVRLSIAFSKPSTEFHTFFERYFVSILPSVLRYKLYCGFIPWIIHRHPLTGDKIPMLVPLGSFSWHVQAKDTAGGVTKKTKFKKHKNSSYNGISESDSFGSNNNNMDYNCACEYVVESTGGFGMGLETINVINLVDPMLLSSGMCVESGDRGGLYGKPRRSASVQAQYSPLYVALQKYLALDLAQQRRFSADAWNSTARLFTTKTPPTVQNERAGRDEIPYGTTRFQQAQMPEGFFTYDNMKLQYESTSKMVSDALEASDGRGDEHIPAVYSLPAHYNLVQQPELRPLMDLEMLERQYRVAVAQSLGIPLHLIDSETGTSRNISNESLPFSSEMVLNTCQSLTTLMTKVLLHMYSAVYDTASTQEKGHTGLSGVRFEFSTEELYSENMKSREDDKVRLQKAASNSHENTPSISDTKKT